MVLYASSVYGGYRRAKNGSILEANDLSATAQVTREACAHTSQGR